MMACGRRESPVSGHLSRGLTSVRFCILFSVPCLLLQQDRELDFRSWLMVSRVPPLHR